jgi:hypothetical protein
MRPGQADCGAIPQPTVTVWMKEDNVQPCFNLHHQQKNTTPFSLPNVKPRGFTNNQLLEQGEK